MIQLWSEAKRGIEPSLGESRCKQEPTRGRARQKSIRRENEQNGEMDGGASWNTVYPLASAALQFLAMWVFKRKKIRCAFGEAAFEILCVGKLQADGTGQGEILGPILMANLDRNSTASSNGERHPT